MARIGIPGRVGPGDDMDWLAQEIERRRTWERELTASLPTVVRSIVGAQLAIDGGASDATDFPLTSGSWVTVASVSITPPVWANKAIANASAMLLLVSPSTYMVPIIRLAIDGNTSMEGQLPPVRAAVGLPYFVFGSLSFTKKLATLGASVNLSAQVYVTDATVWSTGALNRVAQISATATFTR